MRRTLNKYIATFYYFDKNLLALSATSDSISFASFAAVIGEPVGIAHTKPWLSVFY